MITIRNPRDIREDIDEKRDEADAIVALAEAEERDLTPAEQKAFDKIVGVGKEGDKNYKPGEIGELKAELDRAEKHEQLVNERRQRDKLDEMFHNGSLRFPTDDGFGGHNRLATSSRSRWRTNAQGQRFAILNRDDRFSSLVRTPCENAFGHSVLAYAFGTSRDTPDPVVNAMREGTGAAGGFTIGEEMLGEVIDLARAKSVLMDAGVRTVAMTTDSMNIPALEGDVSPELRGEGEAIPFSDVTIGQRKLSTRTAGAITKVSRELWEDSPTLLAEQLQNWMGTKLALEIDNIGLNGSTSKPAGFFGTAGINGTGSIGGIDWADVSAAVTRIRVNNHEPNSFIMHPTIHDDLFNIETGDGTNSARGWLEAPPTIRGKQYLPTTNCPLAKMAIGDFTKFFMGVRTGIVIEISREAGNAFQNHEVYVKATARFDFVSVDDSAFEILTGITS